VEIDEGREAKNDRLLEDLVEPGHNSMIPGANAGPEPRRVDVGLEKERQRGTVAKRSRLADLR
jgi:hypothetical protein